MTGTVSYPNFVAGAAIVADQHDQNNADHITNYSSIGNDQLLGGITADKLTDRYELDTIAMLLLPISQAADLASPVLYIVNTAGTSLCKIKPTLKDGYESFLCAIQYNVVDIDQNGGTYYPSMSAFRNSTLLGGASVDLTADGEFDILANQDPITNPLCAFANGDYIEFNLGKSAAGAGNMPKLRGLTAVLMYKHVLVG